MFKQMPGSFVELKLRRVCSISPGSFMGSSLYQGAF